MPTDIPNVRGDLKWIVYRLRKQAKGLEEEADRLEALDDRMTRKPTKRGPVKAKKISLALSRKLVATALANPGMLHREVGLLHGVDGGRVTEAFQRLEARGRGPETQGTLPGVLEA